MSVVLQQRSIERQMLDAIGESVMATDADGRVTYVNQAAAEAFQAPDIGDLLGRSVHDLLTPTASRRELQEIAEAIMEGRSWTGVLTGRPPGRLELPPPGHPRPVLRRGRRPSSAPSASVGTSPPRSPRRPGPGPATSASGGSSTRARSPWASSAPTSASSAPTRRWSGCSATRTSSWPGRPSRRSPTPTTSRTTSTARSACCPAQVSSGPDPEAVHPQGRRRSSPAASPATVVRDDDGVAMYGIGTVEDLTATLAPSPTIQEQKERLALTLEAAGVATWDLDLLDHAPDGVGQLRRRARHPVRRGPRDLRRDRRAWSTPTTRHLFLEPNPDEGAADRFDVEFRMVPPDGDGRGSGCKGSLRP